MTALAIDTAHSATERRQEAGLLLRSIRGHADSPLIPLGIGRHVIGSGPEADVRLDVHGVEAQHAVLLVGPQRTVLKGFSRFTWVNDGVIRECAVKPGDRICFGPVEFEIVKPKSRRRRLPAAKPALRHAEPSQMTAAPAFSGWATTQIMPLIAEVRPQGPTSTGHSRREKLISELNNELLQHLAQLVERETVAADRERRVVEQTAQLEGRRRIAEDRQREFERVQSELARSEAEWQKKSAELTEQSARLQAERESIEHDRQKLAEDLARLATQTESIEQRRATLDVREARLDEQQSALELRAGHLNHQEQRHAEVVSQALVTSKAYSDDVHRLAEQKSALERFEEQLQQEREHLQREREQYDAERNTLISERVHLATREVEIGELRRRIHEQQAEFDARSHQTSELVDEAGSHHASTGQMSAELAEREQRIAEAESTLAVQRSDLDERKREIDEQRAAWMLERHTEAARSNTEHREPDHESQAEIEMLRSQIGELQSRLREERGLWEMERSELSARVEAVETPPPSEAVEVMHSSSGDVAELQAQLEAERARHEQERAHWESEQDLLLRDRQALEAEWRRLEARAEQAYNTFEESVTTQEVSPVPPPIPAHLLSDLIQSTAAASEEAWSEGEASPQGFDASPQDASSQGFEGHDQTQFHDDLHQATDWNSPDQEQAGFDENPEYAAEASFDDPNADGQPFETESPRPVAAVGGDVISLRAQLAELFGLQTPAEDEQTQDYAGTSQDSEAGFDSPNSFDSNGFETSEFDRTEHNSFGGEQRTSELDETAEEAPAEEEVGDQSDEDIMSAYLARLLKKSPEEEQPAPKPVKVAEPVAEPVTPAPPVHDQEMKPGRRLNAEEKETLRANMDSFRELANQHSRAAVAKHKSKELKSGMQTTSVVAVLLTLVGLILASAEFWTSSSYLMYGLVCLALAGGVGTYTLINGMKIRRLKAVERAAAEMTEALAGEADEDKEEKTETPPEVAAE